MKTHNTTKYNLQYELNKTKQTGSWQGTEIKLVLPENIPCDILKECGWNFSRNFKMLIYTTISRENPSDDLRHPGQAALATRPIQCAAQLQNLLGGTVGPGNKL